MDTSIQNRQEVLIIQNTKMETIETDQLVAMEMLTPNAQFKIVEFRT